MKSWMGALQREASLEEFKEMGVYIRAINGIPGGGLRLWQIFLYQVDKASVRSPLTRFMLY